MAPFNWFNRQYNEPPAESTENSPEEKLEAEAKPAEAAPSNAEPAVGQDQLNWAKLAYENIRKRQQQETTAQAGETPADQAELSPTDAASEVSPATDEATTTPEPIEEISAPPSTEPPPALETPPAVSEEPIAASAALPFWAQAETERLERLERLKEEAAANEILEASPAAIEAPAPDLTLDEGFLWSAEILAAQGRRPEDVSIEEITWLKRLRQGLDKTRRSLVNQLKAIVGQGPLNQDAVMEIESLLLQADVGVEATDYIIDSLQAKLRQETLPPSEAIAYLKELLQEMLEKPLQSQSSLFVPEKDKLNIWLVTGVNGAGKTTTIGKIAHIAQKSGYRCLIAAADTFRAAAVQQVKVWGDRSSVEVIANPGKNTDPAAVVFDAIAAAQSRNTELLIIDTAGRLQNKKNLMEELSKIRRIIDRKAPGAIVESLLVLDSTLGQNGLRQAEVFSEAAKLSGVVLTKLDGTAKGGIALAVVQQLGLPIRFIGAGEGIEDLRPFSSYEFVEALLSG
ncbi:signal recognition particle-docking protein FtsY [Phormidium tenue FACHB-886]|nr:signal recognition particle-docking protein FtsY [Phormidium tenue FACHB-886]